MIDVLPDFLVSFFPLLAGIALLIRDFDWLVLGVLIALMVFSMVGNGFVRGFLACKYCKQKEIGCPAERLFKKKRG